MTSQTCPICNKTATEHTRKEMDLCFAKYLETLNVELDNSL